MDDFIPVEVLCGSNKLEHIALGFKFSETFPSLDQLIEGLVSTDFKKNVDVLLIFKVLFKEHNVFIEN